MIGELQDILRRFFASYCRECGQALEEADGWGKYKCPDGHHPDKYNKGLGF